METLQIQFYPKSDLISDNQLLTAAKKTLHYSNDPELFHQELIDIANMVDFTLYSGTEWLLNVQKSLRPLVNSLLSHKENDQLIWTQLTNLHNALYNI